MHAAGLKGSSQPALRLSGAQAFLVRLGGAPGEQSMQLGDVGLVLPCLAVLQLVGSFQGSQPHFQGPVLGRIRIVLGLGPVWLSLLMPGAHAWSKAGILVGVPKFHCSSS